MPASDLQNPQIAEIVERVRSSLDALVICLSRSWGGLEQVAAQDALEIGALGLRVRVLCLEGTPIHEHLAHRSEVKLIPLNFMPRNYFDLGMRTELNRLCDDGVTLIHTHQTTILSTIVPWVWRRPNLAILATRHIMNNHDKRNFFHAAIYRRLDALLVMSQALRKNVLETHPVPEKQVRTINLGLDFDRFDPDKIDARAQRERWGADKDTIVIGLVGRIDPAKGQATFIRAAASLMKHLRAGESLRFVIVGEETLGSAADHLAELKQMVSQFHLEDHVVFAGYQGNIPEIMRAFDIFVMPSRREAFGLVAIEAMAMECPIVISKGGSSEEIVGPEGEGGRGEFGMTVRPDDAFDLQRQLRYLLDNPMERVQMGQRARTYVKKFYDRRVRVLKTLEIYERALRRRGIL